MIRGLRNILVPGSLGGLATDDVDSSSALIELDFSVHECEEGIIATHSHPAARMVFCSDLPNENVSCPNCLAAELLDPSSLTIGISTISAGPLSFFMCHCS